MLSTPRHRGLAALLAAVLAVPLVAAPRTAIASTAPAAPTRPGAAPEKVTLITGDTVVYAKDGAGRASATLEPGASGEARTYQAQQDEHGYYVIPADAAPYVAKGLLDKELFNVDYLAANGYGDAKATRLPLIVQYEDGAKAADLAGKARSLKGGAEPMVLESIDGAAIKVDKKQAATFWKSLNTARTSGLRKVWLDGKAKALDDVSNPQIGAPTAWAAGYDGTGATVGVIDTGIDAAHPDLRDRIVSARNFVPAGMPGGGDPDEVADRVGHGTHVASIIAGSGAASSGRYKGVAPGTRLTIAKALDDTGSGNNSEIIAAMQWQAATARARVVNMSLGSMNATDGTDPLSQAANELTAEYGTLFVVAAGNSGPGRYTVASPGAATSALTVGAVDSADRIADFSSRGPRVSDDVAIKPEITAPGVNIIAARAAGTSLGEGSSVPGGGPIDEHHTAASGTSMAAPHVAAAAGVLAAQHPGWTPDQLKNALAGTAKPGDSTVYDQGSGRLDLGRAVTQQVFDDLATVHSGFTDPYTGQTLTKKVTFRNIGQEPVTLALSMTLKHGDAPAAAGMATLTPSSLTVPAGGTATADLTIEPTIGDAGWYEGRLTATGGTARLTAPIAFRKQAEMATVSIKLVGKPEWKLNPGVVSALRVSDTDPLLAGEPMTVMTDAWRATDTPGTVETKLRLARGGVYSIGDMPWWYTEPGRQLQYATLLAPEVKLDGDTTVTLDATEAEPLRVSTPRTSEPVFMNVMYARTTASGRMYAGASLLSYEPVNRGTYWVTPVRRAPTVGTSTLLFDQIRRAPEVELDVPGLRLNPRYVSEHDALVPKFASDRRLRLTTGDDLRAGADVRGKLIFLTARNSLQLLLADLEAAIKGGAAGVITSDRFAWLLSASAYTTQNKLPVLWIDTGEADRLGAALARGPYPSAALRATPTTPFEYKLAYYLKGTTAGRLSFAPKARELTEIDTTYHARFAPQPGTWGPYPNFTEVNHTYSPEQRFSIRGSHGFAGPTSRTEYYNMPGRDVMWERDYAFNDYAAGEARHGTSARGFTRPTREREDWNEPLVPAQLAAGPGLPDWISVGLYCDGCRQGDRLRLRALSPVGFGYYSDASDPTHRYQGAPGTEEVHLFSGNTEVEPQFDDLGVPYYTVPAGAGTYRLTDSWKDAVSDGKVETTWTFRSARPASDDSPHACLDTVLWEDRQPCAQVPMIRLRYALGLPADDTVQGGRPFTFTVKPDGGRSPSLRRAWISADGGGHWTQAVVLPGDKVLAVNPKGPAKISIKVEASDRDGNAVQQVLTDAYLVR
ncbi:Serine protease, subtilisin family [Nonomuraea solani]|uniref:Serine protease, subtilisin family n=1 Tax=Nonomuraea solani TaxID=1144553 RepID=A0A1H5YE87_9ACTN|nr:S8 family serine peptidase [Nonomuraea solani]SEG22328.1 Serine protease, subtilisin family [Nonomuraea solani]